MAEIQGAPRVDFDPNDPLLSVRKVATMLDVTPYTVRRWLREGQLAGVKVGTWKVPTSAVRAFVNHRYSYKEC